MSQIRMMAHCQLSAVQSLDVVQERNGLGSGWGRRGLVLGVDDLGGGADWADLG